MILVVGGQGAGKRHYVQGLGFAQEEIAPAVLDARPVLADLHLFLQQPFFDGMEQLDEATFAALVQKKVIICAEVGSGVVPIQAAERLWRERVGRACTRLAQEADTVVRLVCGIPHYLKGSGA